MTNTLRLPSRNQQLKKIASDNNLTKDNLAALTLKSPNSVNKWYCTEGEPHSREIGPDTLELLALKIHIAKTMSAFEIEMTMPVDASILKEVGLL